VLPWGLLRSGENFILKEIFKMRNTMSKILVTGGSGFIGSYVVENLLVRGLDVVILDIKESPLADNHLECKVGSITDQSVVDKLVSECDGVIHLGGLLGTSETIAQAKLMSQVNIYGGLNILDACKKFGKQATIISTGNFWMLNCYAITKRTMAKFALMYNREFGTRIAVVRGMNAYGPRQKAQPVRKIMPNFVIPALRNQPLNIYGSGNQNADLIYATDMAEILVRALLMEHDSYDAIFEAGMGKYINVIEIAEFVIKLAESTSEILYHPKRQGEDFDAVIRADTSTLKPLEITEENMVQIEEGIRKTIDWYRENMEIN